MSYETQDPHRRNAALLFNKPPAEISKEERQITKILNIFASRGLSYLDNANRDRLLGQEGLTTVEITRFVHDYQRLVLGIFEGDQLHV